jgi:hypothetical protein
MWLQTPVRMLRGHELSDHVIVVRGYAVRDHVRVVTGYVVGGW